MELLPHLFIAFCVVRRKYDELFLLQRNGAAWSLQEWEGGGLQTRQASFQSTQKNKIALLLCAGIWPLYQSVSPALVPIAIL